MIWEWTHIDETLSKPIDSTFAETSKQSLFTFSSSWAGLLLSVRWENPREPLWEARQKVGPRIEYGLPCQPTWTSIYNMLTTWRLLGDYLGTTWGILGDYLGNTWGLLGDYLGTTWVLSMFKFSLVCVFLHFVFFNFLILSFSPTTF